MRAFLVLGLLSIFCFALFGEKIPIHDGAGFDGEFYRQVTENFSKDFFSSGYDAFRVQRIFPFFVIHYGFQLLHVQPTHQNLMQAMQGIHIFNLLLQVFLFLKIAKILQWKKSTFAVLFACFFFNFFTLKNCGYEVFQTDAFAITLALASFYFYLQKKNAWCLAVGFLGTVTWPLVMLQSILLVTFNRLPEKEISKNCFKEWIILCSYAVLSLMVIAALYSTQHVGVVVNLMMRNSNLPFTLTSLFLNALFYFFLVRYVFDVFPISKILVVDMWHACRVKFLAILIFIWILIKLYLDLHTNEEIFSSNSIFALQILLRPLKYPLISIVGHVAFYGIFPILVIFTFRDFAKAFVEKSAGFALLFVLFLILALDSESRHMASLLPILLLPLGSALNRLELRNFQVVFLVVLQLLLSHFYLPINTAPLLSQLEAGTFNLPAAQRYFMNFGAYMSLKSYLVWLGISAVAFLVCYAVVFRNKVKKQF